VFTLGEIENFKIFKQVFTFETCNLVSPVLANFELGSNRVFVLRVFMIFGTVFANNFRIHSDVRHFFSNFYS